MAEQLRKNWRRGKEATPLLKRVLRWASGVALLAMELVKLWSSWLRIRTSREGAGRLSTSAIPLRGREWAVGERSTAQAKSHYLYCPNEVKPAGLVEGEWNFTWPSELGENRATLIEFIRRQHCPAIEIQEMPKRLNDPALQEWLVWRNWESSANSHCTPPGRNPLNSTVGSRHPNLYPIDKIGIHTNSVRMIRVPQDMLQQLHSVNC